MLKIRGFSPLKGHSRYFASHIKKNIYLKKWTIALNRVLCTVQDIRFRAGEPLKDTGSAQDLVQFTASSQVTQLWLTNAASVQALPGTGKILPRVQLICAEERFQWPVSVGANSCGWEYLKPPKYTSTCLTLPSPKQPHKPSAALPECYKHNFQPRDWMTERQTACDRQLSNAKLGDFNHSEAKTYRIKFFSHLQKPLTLPEHMGRACVSQTLALNRDTGSPCSSPSSSINRTCHRLAIKCSCLC